MNKKELASIIDHSMLRLDINRHSIMAGCLEAIKYDFGYVAIHSCNISVAKKYLEGHDIGISSTVAFPLGSWSAEMKAFEAKDALKKGATEIDFVINVGALKDKDYDYVKKEMKIMKQVGKDIIVKSIIEVGFLSNDEIVKVCQIAAGEGMDFVKTSTGFFKWPTPEIIKLMCESVKGTKTKIKAAGGMTSASDAKKMIEAGAQRLGTSFGVKIVEDWQE